MHSSPVNFFLLLALSCSLSAQQPGVNQVQAAAISQAPPSSGQTSQALSGVLNAAVYRGTTVTDQLNAAIADCAKTTCSYVDVPASMGNGYWSITIPQGVSVRDHRRGTTRVFTQNNGSSSGYGTGCWYANHSSSFPPVAPTENTQVECYFENNTTSSNIPVWAINTDVNVIRGTNAGAFNEEHDLGDFGEGKDQPIPSQLDSKENLLLGYSGVNHPITAAISGSAPYGGYGAHYALHFTGIKDAILSAGNYRAFATTQNITASGSPQIVRLDAAQFWAGEYISIDSGANREDVLLTATSPTSKTITGVFTRNHALGVSVNSYASMAGIDFSENAFSSSPLILGSIQVNRNFLQPVNIGIKNSSGILQLPFWWDASDATHFRDIGGSSFYWETSKGTTLLRLVATAAAPGLEYGNLNVANTPYVDFHSSGNPNNYDARIIASSGGTHNGMGNLDIQAAGVIVNGNLTVTGAFKGRLESSAPTSSSSICNAGALAYDSNYIYICTATNTWKRASLSSF